MTLWTCVAKCRSCNRELNRAEHVPDAERGKVAMTAPIVAICPVREHNTFSDLNLGVELRWTAEAPGAQASAERRNDAPAPEGLP